MSNAWVKYDIELCVLPLFGELPNNIDCNSSKIILCFSSRSCLLGGGGGDIDTGGVVGAGGNVGAVCFGLGFRQMDNIRAFYLMGGCVLASGILTAFISIKGHAGLLWGKDSDEAIAAYKRTLQVPNANAESEEGVDEA